MRGLTPSCGSDCSAAPKLASLYVFNNLCFNIAVLNLLRNCGTPWPHLLGGPSLPDAVATQMPHTCFHPDLSST